jgi:hypothetical protein
MGSRRTHKDNMAHDFKPGFEVRNEQIEKQLREIGHSIGDKMPEGYGFALFLFGYENKELFYISSADRAGIIASLKEFIAKHQEN